MKQSNMLLVATSILGMSIGGAQAAITWDGFSISYSVSANGADFSADNPFGGQVQNITTVNGATGSKQKALYNTSGDAVDSSINSSVTGSVGGIDMTMNTGATGRFIDKGIEVSGWQNITTTENNGLPDISVETAGKTQNLSAFNRRAFTVDAAEDYILTGALLSGVIKTQNLASNGGPFSPANIVDYDWSAEVRLEASVVNGAGDFLRNESDIATLVLDLTQPLNKLSQTVHLESSTGTPDEFYRYLLKTQIKLETTVNNRDFFFGDYFGNITEGAFNTMGTFADPFAVSGELRVSAVPVPGAVVFFVSGMLGLFGVSRRRVTAN